MNAFREACGITLENANEHLKYLRRSYAKAKRPLAHTLAPNFCSKKFRAKLLGLGGATLAAKQAADTGAAAAACEAA